MSIKKWIDKQIDKIIFTDEVVKEIHEKAWFNVKMEFLNNYQQYLLDRKHKSKQGEKK